MRSLIARYEQWKFARETRPKRWWQWWRPEPTQWHLHRIYGPMVDRRGIPITGLECMRRLTMAHGSIAVRTRTSSSKSVIGTQSADPQPLDDLRLDPFRDEPAELVNARLR